MFIFRKIFFSKPHLRLIALVGLIVPRRLRADWRQEWEAELRYRERLLAGWDRLDWRNKLDLLRRSLSAFWDALLLQPRRLEDEMFQDLRFGVRMLLKSPGFTLVAVLTLALGIGTNTMIYSMINAMFFQALPVSKPHELVILLQKTPFIPLPLGLPYADFKDLRERNDVFTDLVAYMPTAVHWSVAGQPAQRTWIEMVSPNYFALLGVSAAEGRVFQSEEGQAPGADPLVVLTHEYWQQRFGGDRSIVGRTIHLNGKPFTVIGVTPASFVGTDWAIGVTAFVPASMAGTVMRGGEEFLNSRSADAFRLMGRLKPGVSVEQARSAVKVLYQQLANEHPKEKEKKSPLVVAERRARPDPSLSELAPLISVVFIGLVGLVLFIACANVANLMLARAVSRTREMAIRNSLGASRFRLLRQWLTESVVLSLMAGVVAMGVAWGSGILIQRFVPQGDMPVRQHEGDWTVPVFTFLLSILAGVITGFLPAWRATRVDLNFVLKESAPTSARPARFRLRSLLVISQVAICLVLLVSAGLFLRSLQRAGEIDFGFRPNNVLLASVDLGLQGYSESQAQQFHRRLVERVKALPGVQGASLTSVIPFSYQVDFTEITIDGGIPQVKDDFLGLNYAAVGEDYFVAAGTSIFQGRGFTASDTSDTQRVGVINQALAQRLWPNQDPLGKRFQLGRAGPWVEVVGLTRTGKYFMLSEEPRPYLYLPLTQQYASPVHLFLRTAQSPVALAGAVREAIAGLDPHLPVFNLVSMEQHLQSSAFALMPMRAGMALAGVQGVLGLLLGMMGLYAVVAYTVRARTREIGVRIALGAQRGDILRLVVREGVKHLLFGVIVGLVFAVGAGLAMSKLLWGIRPVEIPVLAAVVALLGLAALLACWLPARRATKVDPLVALRQE